MKFRYIIAVLLLLPRLASAQQPGRMYFSSTGRSSTPPDVQQRRAGRKPVHTNAAASTSGSARVEHPVRRGTTAAVGLYCRAHCLSREDV